MSSSHSSRVWAGDLATVREAERDYQRDKGQFLMKFAVALYSMRADEQCATRLVQLLSDLYARAESDVKSDETTDVFIDHLDTLSTLLEWIARQPQSSSTCGPHYRFMARQLTNKGLDLCDRGYGTEHSRVLLYLTDCRIDIAAGKPDAWINLWLADNYLHAVVDVRQKARILGKLGFLYRKVGERLRGYKFGFMAIMYAPWVPRNVTLKNVAALLGYDR